VDVRKAVITAAGRGVRLFPAVDTVQKGMLPFVDCDGLSKPVVQIIAEEALESGIEEICIVCAPGDEPRYLSQLKLLHDNLLEVYRRNDWAQELAHRLEKICKCLYFVVQEEPLGYGHAVHCAKEFVGKESFLLLLSDHLYVSDLPGERCAEQVMQLARAEGCAVAAVQATREHLIGRYGTVRGKRVSERSGVCTIEKIEEKPSLSLAELELYTPGLRAGHYLCFFGMHVLGHTIFDLLEESMKEGSDNGGGLQLTPALNALAQREKYLALEVSGSRYDIGAKFGMLQAQVAMAMAGEDSDQVLATLVDVLAEAKLREKHQAGDSIPGSSSSR
jgi:UTP--glucose-1-phosphate uridylyltransferase